MRTFNEPIVGKGVSELSTFRRNRIELKWERQGSRVNLFPTIVFPVISEADDNFTLLSNREYLIANSFLCCRRSR